MSKRLILALLLGVLLVAAPLARASDEEADDEGDDEDDAPAAGDDDEKDVVVMTEKNVDSLLKKHKYALVEFYAPWCGHCKTLKPKYAKAATAIKAYNPDVLIAKVDATEEKELGTKYEVQGYPTLKWFVDGKATEYAGGRETDDLIRWVKKKTGPATSDIAALEALEEAKAEGIFLIAYLPKLEGKDFDAYVAAAEASDAATYLTTTNKDVAKAMGLTSAPAYALGRTYSDFGFEAVPAAGHGAFEGEGEFAAQLEAFVKSEKLPAYIEFSQETSQTIFGSGIAHQVIVAAPEADFKKGSDLTKALLALSQATRGKVVIVTCKSGSAVGKPIIEYFGLDPESRAPQVVGFDSGAGKKFKYPEGADVAAEELTAFANAVVDGTAQKFFKSAPVPTGDAAFEKGVAVVVGNTVETIVKDPKKDVLLEVYAPWCGYCKTLAPIWEKLAKRFAGVESVVIAKMDGTVNEHPKVEASGFPTLIFFPAGESEGVPYEGGRTLKDFTKFLKKNAVVPFELPKKEKKGGQKAKKAAKEEEEAEEAHDEL